MNSNLIFYIGTVIVIFALVVLFMVLLGCEGLRWGAIDQTTQRHISELEEQLKESIKLLNELREKVEKGEFTTADLIKIIEQTSQLAGNIQNLSQDIEYTKKIAEERKWGVQDWIAWLIAVFGAYPAGRFLRKKVGILNGNIKK